MNAKSKYCNYYNIFSLCLFFVLFCQSAFSQTIFTMPFNGRITYNVYSNNSYLLQNPVLGEYDLWTEVEDTITIRSTNGRPFTFRGYYSVGGNDIFALYMGNSMNYPLNGFYADSGYIDIYCYSGAITLYFFHSPYSGDAWSMNFEICFPDIYDVHVERTNCTYTNVFSQGGYNYYRSILYRSIDEGPEFTKYQPSMYNPDSIFNGITAGKKYIYYITDDYNYDTSDHCSVPPHYFRTPKQQDCNSCEHYKNCLDYTKLSGTKQTTCYKGSTYWPDSTECMVDDGPSSSTSQHTVHTDTNSRDVNTNNLLRPIPIGDTASVRLGNWSTGNGGESILYEIHVDTNDYDLMMLKYAVVFLDPQVEGEQQPRFSIRLTDENCIPIEPLCYSRDIFPNSNTQNWNTGTSGSGHSYVWHDWWTMGINLSPYHGKIIYLQLFTYDGSADGAAYAYFTLHCDRKQIDHIQQCGDGVANTFYAPEGFHYRWFNVDSSNVTLSSQRMLSVSDSGLYRCWVTPSDNSNASCGFYINALSSPRYPHARFEHVDSIGTCMFKVRFVNRSFISAGANDTVPLWTNEDCETAFWDFGNGETSTNYNAETIYRAAGTYYVTLITTIAGGACADTITIPVVLNWTHPAPYISGNNSLCPGKMTQLTIHNTQSQKWLLPNTNHPPQSATVNLTPALTQHSFIVNCAISDDNGCKDTLHYPIHIHDSYNTHESRTICQAQLESGWHWRGHIFYEGTTSDQYYYPDTTVNGCDSNVTLNLTVNETFHRYQTYRYCDYTTTFPYPPNSSNPLIVYDSVGQYDYTFHTAQNCDSIIHLTLLQHTVTHDTIRANICRGFAFDTLDFHFSAEQNNSVGIDTITHSATEHLIEEHQIQTCDSTTTLILTVNPQSQTQRNPYRNENALPYIFNGVSFNNEVDTIFHLTNRYGCDSAIHLILHINFNATTHYYDTICSNALPYLWDGITFYSEGSDTVTLYRANGADSSFIRHLTVHPTYNNTTLDTICDNSSITFCGTSYTLADTYIHHLASVNNCDSTETLILTINQTQSTTLNETICSNNPYIFDNEEIDSSGTYNKHFLTIQECDSSVTLNLTVLPVTESYVFDTILENELNTYSFLGHHFQGDVQDSLFIITNHAGCDSSIHFWLTVNWNQTTIVNQTICRDILSPSYNWDGTLFTPDDLPAQGNIIVKTVTLSTIHGADSVVTRRLTVNPIFNQEFHYTICSNESYSFCNNTYSETGDYTHNLLTSKGCDSIVTLHLTVNAVTYSTYDTSILENALASFTFNGHSFSGDVSNQTIVIPNSVGCDSTINFTLHIIPNVSTTDTTTICQSELPYSWNGVVFYAAGTKSTLLHTIDGADSSVLMILYVNPTYNDSTFLTICDNETTTFNNVVYNQSCIHTDTLTTMAGCDSLTTLMLTVNAVTYSDLYDTVVENQMPYSLNGVTYSLSQAQPIAPLIHFLRDTVTITNVMHCDSVIDLRLYIHINVYDTVDSTICDNFMPLQWNARTFNFESGIYDYVLSDTLIAWTGADSILTMRLHVNPTYDLHFFDTICSNDQITFNETTYNSPGIYPHPMNSSLLCDSLETLHLTVFGTSAATISDTIFENTLRQTYTFNGVLFDTLLFGAGEQTTPRFSQLDSTIIITNQIGCDSTIHFTLCVHWNVAATADSTLCENLLPINWNARTFYFETGITDYELMDTLVAHTGADSLLTMRLHVDTNSHSLITETVLENNLPHTFNGVTYTLAQMEAIRDENEDAITSLQDTITIANIKGCDSVIHHTIFIRWNKTTDLHDTICENFMPYLWQGQIIAVSQAVLDSHPSSLDLTDSVVYSAVGGEDSIVVMHLHLKRNSGSTLYDTIVENQMNHLWNGVTFTWDDTIAVDQRHADLQHTGIIPNAAGCDSIAAMNLMVWLNRTASADSNVCENYFPFTWNGITFNGIDTTQAGTPTFQTASVMLLTTHGADSMLTMNVTEMYNSYSADVDTIVENSLAWNFNGTMFDHSHFGDTAAYRIPPSSLSFIDSTVIIANHLGCDSIISYRLNVWWNVRTDDDDTLCDNNLPITWNARTFTKPFCQSEPIEGRWHRATLFDTLPAWSGADSTIAMHLHVMPSYDINFNDTVCSSSYIAWYGDTLYETGVYPMSFQTIDGCDSTEYLHFANYPNYDLEYFDTICDYSGLMRFGVEYLGMAHIPTMHGCDSNEIYHLWGMPVSYSNVDTIVSEHQIPFAYNGEWFVDSGVSQQQFILTNQYGCDSIINFTITVMPTVRQTLDSSVCDAMLPLDWDGTIFSTTGVTPTYQNGTSTYQIIDTLPGAYGADSIVTRRLHVSPSYDLTYIDTTCNGAPYPFGDSIYSTTGTYTHTYLTTLTDPIYGVRCDSIETLHLQVNAMSYAIFHDTIVENQLPHTFGGVTFSTTDEIIDSTIIILNTVACDSVITYSLFVYSNSYVNKDTTLCENELPFFWDGRMITHGGLDSVVVLMPDGTDSVTRYWTAVNLTYNSTDTVRVCDSYTWIDGNNYTESTNVDGLTLNSINGCDSVKNLRLTIDHQVTTHDSIQSCDPYTWIDSVTYSASISGPTHLLQTIRGCDSTVVLEFTRVNHVTTNLYDTICRGVRYYFAGKEYGESGIYSDSLQTTTDCDSVVFLNLHVLEPPTISFTVDHDCDTRIYTVTAHCDVPWYEWSSFPEDPALTGHEHDRTIQVRPTTHERYLFTADYKEVPTCRSDSALYLSPLLRPHALIEYTPEFLTYDQLHMSAISRCTNEKNRYWTVNGNDMGDHERISYLADPRTDDSVEVTLIAQHDICYDTAVVVIPFRKAAIWAPNAFTPEESSNTHFYIRYIGITDYSIDLYTRGGVLVWHSEDMNEGWDGTYKGKPCPQESYVWIIHYRDVTAPKNLLSMKGTVTLLR